MHPFHDFLLDGVQQIENLPEKQLLFLFFDSKIFLKMAILKDILITNFVNY